MKLKPLSERPANAPVFGEPEFIAIRLDAVDMRAPVSAMGLNALAKFELPIMFGSLAEAREILLNPTSSAEAGDELRQLRERNNALANEVARLNLRLERIKALTTGDVTP